jgi:hypothetical protein
MLKLVAHLSNMACRYKKNDGTTRKTVPKSLLRIRIRMILGLPDPNPLARGTDPDPTLLSLRC